MTTAAPKKPAAPAKSPAEIKQAAAVEAYAHIHANVYAPVFFEKLASAYGVVPANDEECQELLTMGTKLRTVHDASQQKQAAQTGNTRQAFLKAAHHRLDTVMTQYGLAPVQQIDETAEIKAAAASLTLQPDISQAVLQLLIAAS